METREIYKNVILEHIRPEDGAQRFRYGPRRHDIFWLTGPDRYPHGEVGLKGDILYVSYGSSGKYVFSTEPCMGSIKNVDNRIRQLETEKSFWLDRALRLEEVIQEYLRGIDEEDWTTEDQMLFDSLKTIQDHD